VVEEITVPAGMVEDIPVALPWTSYERGVNNTEWVLEPRQVAPGLVMACCILPTSEVTTGISVMNLSRAPHKLNADTCLGVAVPVEVITPRGTNEAGSQAQKMEGSAHLSDGAPGPSGEHLSPLLNNLKDTLSDTEFKAVSKLVHDYADVFSHSEIDLGHMEALHHRIDTGDNRPIKQPLRRHPKIHEDFIDKQV